MLARLPLFSYDELKRKCVAMISKKLFVVSFVYLTFAASMIVGQEMREWGDESGQYTVKAQLIAYDDEHVVLEKENDELISIATKDLSKQDQEFLKSEKASELLNDSASSLKTWTMQSGLKVKAIAVDFAQRSITVQRQRGKIYVNDRPLANLPAVYQKMVPKIVGHFEGREIDDEQALEKWVRRTPQMKKTFECEGVLLELENGDRYGVPFFFFSESDRNALEPGWNRWLAAIDDSETQEKEAFYLRAQAQANAENIERMRQVSEVNLQLQAYDAGLFDLWEVALYPPNGGRPMSVVVPGRDSREATNAALQKYPNARVGAVAKSRRRGGRLR